MKCIVTGAAGFIGSHLCERLIADGHEVVGFDNLFNGKISNLDSIKDNARFLMIYGDIRHDFNNAITDGKDWVFHLSALADIVPSIENPEFYHDVNVNGTVKVLEASRHSKVKRFVYAASSSCYGLTYDYPTPESARCRPKYPYALTKYIGEEYVRHWEKVYKLPAISLRLFNVYGPRARTNGTYGAVFGTFLSQLANNKPLTIVGDGKQSRDFTFVTDVVDAFVKAAEFDGTGVFNIGTGRAQSINHLCDLLGPATIEFIPDRPGEPRRTEANASMANMLLKWHPKVSFKEGVLAMKQLVRQYKDAPLWTKETIEEATKSWFKHLGE